MDPEPDGKGTIQSIWGKKPVPNCAQVLNRPPSKGSFLFIKAVPPRTLTQQVFFRGRWEPFILFLSPLPSIHRNLGRADCGAPMNNWSVGPHASALCMCGEGGRYRTSLMGYFWLHPPPAAEKTLKGSSCPMREGVSHQVTGMLIPQTH